MNNRTKQWLINMTFSVIMAMTMASLLWCAILDIRL